MHIIFHVTIIVFFTSLVSSIDVNDPVFKKLPPIFHIQDEIGCSSEHFCTLSITLYPQNIHNPSIYWNMIEKTISDPKFYNHNELSRAICVENLCPQQNLTITECYNVKYESLGLRAIISDVNCDGSGPKYHPGKLDYFILVATVLYLSLLIYATFCREEKSQFMDSLSIKRNWHRLTAINNKPDFQKLKFIQGIRFYNMLLIILCHTLCSYFGGFISNTEYFETMHQNVIRSFVCTLLVFLVQTFFLISAFFLGYHVRQSMEDYRESKLRYLAVTFLNRYLRIISPVVAVSVLTTSTWIMDMSIFNSPIKEIFFNAEYNRCIKNWWTNVLFISNWIDPSNMCYFIIWYMSADTQLYLIGLVILMVVWKYPHRSAMIFSVSVCLGVLITAMNCYWYELDIIYRIFPQNAKIENFRSFKLIAIYMSTTSNLATYMLGLGIGCFYYHVEGSTYKRTLHYFLMTLFVVLPTGVVIISSKEYPAFVNIILAGLVKPVYAVGIGAGILAMSRQKNGIIKYICQLRPVIFLSNFTYSTYVTQFVVVFYRTATATKPMHVSDLILFMSFIQDAILAISCGFLMHILIEMPALQLQKKFVPQVRGNRKDRK